MPLSVGKGDISLSLHNGADNELRIVALIERLKQTGAASELAIERAARAAQQSGSRIDQALNRLGLVSDEALVNAWSAVTGLKITTASAFPKAGGTLASLPTEFLRHSRCIPLSMEGEVLILAIEDALDDFSPAAVASRTGLNVELRLARSGDIDAWLKQLPDDDRPAAPAQGVVDDALTLDVERLKDRASDAPVVRLVNAIIDRAIESKASDIHLTAQRAGSRLRYRIDGILRDAEPPGQGLHASVISRIKIMAGLDIAERRLPQDGRIRATFRGQEIDLRVSTMPHAHGEGVVLRVLDRSAVVRFVADERRLEMPSKNLAYQVPNSVSFSVVGAAGGLVGDQPRIVFLSDGSSTGSVVELRSGGLKVTRRIGWLTGRIEKVEP